MRLEESMEEREMEMRSMKEELRNEKEIKKFKAGIRKWVLENILTKPRPKYIGVEKRVIPRNIVQTNSSQPDIRRFLIDRSSAPAVLVPTPTDRPPPVPARLVPTDNSSRNQGIMKYFTSKEHRK